MGQGQRQEEVVMGSHCLGVARLGGYWQGLQTCHLLQLLPACSDPLVCAWVHRPCPWLREGTRVEGLDSDLDMEGWGGRGEAGVGEGSGGAAGVGGRQGWGWEWGRGAGVRLEWGGEQG